MNMTETTAYFCPKCSSASITMQLVLGAGAECGACGWKGRQEELVVHQFKQDLGSSDEVMAAFMGDFKRLMSQTLAAPLAQILFKWGFFAGRPTPQELTRYIVVMGRASIDALLKERQKLEAERVRGGN